LDEQATTWLDKDQPVITGKKFYLYKRSELFQNATKAALRAARRTFRDQKFLYLCPLLKLPLPSTGVAQPPQLHVNNCKCFYWEREGILNV
jgi:hypothetical protein